MARIQLDNLTVNNAEQYRVILKSPMSLGSTFNASAASDTKVEPTANATDKIQFDMTETQHKLVYFQDIPVGGISFKRFNQKLVVTQANVLKEYSDWKVWEALVEFVIEYARGLTDTVLEKKPTMITSKLPLKQFVKQGEEYIFEL